MTRGRRVVSIVGATGLVGGEIARILHLRRFPLTKLLLFASGRSPAAETTVGGRRHRVERFSLEAVKGSDICFLAVGGQFSRRYARRISTLGPVVIDNSSAFRMERGVPLVVPEVNPEDLDGHRGIVANPNCSTIQMVVVLAPLHRRWRLRRVVVATYQAVSGAGLAAAGELAVQSDLVLQGIEATPRVFPHPIAFNLVPHIDVFDGAGWTREECKMINETRKILHDASVRVIATAVRVPVFRGHSEAVYAEFAEPVDLSEALRILKTAPGVEVQDEPGSVQYPMPYYCQGKDATFVGRLRLDPDSDRGLCMWIVSDNLRKGAALNAVQIAERLI